MTPYHTIFLFSADRLDKKAMYAILYLKIQSS